MRRATFASLAIAVALILLPVIAFATPPDPWWIAEIYDGADGDDIVTLVYESAGIEAASTRPAPLLLRASKMLLVSGPSVIHGLPASQSTRAPPTSAAPMFYSVSFRLQFSAAFPPSCVTQRNLLSAPCCTRRMKGPEVQLGGNGRRRGLMLTILRRCHSAGSGRHRLVSEVSSLNQGGEESVIREVTRPGSRHDAGTRGQCAPRIEA